MIRKARSVQEGAQWESHLQGALMSVTLAPPSESKTWMVRTSPFIKNLTAGFLMNNLCLKEETQTVSSLLVLVSHG